MAQDRFITVYSTTSPQDSGLFGYLLPIFQAATGLKVDIAAVGTGEALALGRRGFADALFVHDRPAEDRFIADGCGVDRRDVMYDDFVIVGPSNDPAHIRGLKNVKLALARIAACQVPFASRGDDSGTARIEIRLWELADKIELRLWKSWGVEPVRAVVSPNVAITYTYQPLLLLALLLASSVGAGAAQDGEATATVPRFEPAPCPKVQGADTIADASCGYLVVPEDRSRPDGRTIRLMVAKYPARSLEKRADPVVYLAGGPGDIAPLDVNGLIAADFIHDRDILVVSERGTMFSEPALTCAPIDQFNRELLGLRFYSEATKRAHLAATEACHRELAATGADLSAYNSTENAADFADLRRVLGLITWNVYGTSYGSYVAQTLMRDHPEGIRSVVLDSVLPTTYTIPGNWWITRAGFDNLFQACAGQTACNAAYPHLEKTFTELVNKFEAEPLTTTVRDAITGKDLKVVLDGGALVDWLRNQNYAAPLLRAAPDLIGGLAAGRPEAIEAIAKDRVGRAPPPGPGVPALGYGLSLGVTCREDYPFATPAGLAASGREAFPDFPASVRGEGVGGWAYVNEDCQDVWKVPAAPAAMRQPVVSGIPTLLISGSFDTLTSLAGAKAAATNLSNATIISIPGVGHVVAPASPCAQAVIVSFLADPHAPDTSCVGALKAPTFASRASP